MAEAPNPFHVAQQQLKAAVDALGAPPELYELLKAPARVVEVQIPVRMDSGRVQVFTGWRSQHTLALGPTKGGVRFHPGVTADEVKALSMWMSFKNGVVGLPYGGGKGGVAVDPRRLSPGELERLARGYVRAIAAVIGPDVDIPAPDVNTGPQVMAWMLDEYEQLVGRSAPAVLTGKPLAVGGSAGREEATGRGVAITVREAAARLGLALRGARIAVQGFGNVGYHAARILTTEMGALLVAAADTRGGAYNPAGLPVAALLDHKARTGSVAGFPGSQPVGPAEVLAVPCDVVIPAALENQIDGAMAARIQARIVVEAANGPTTPEGDAVLAQRGIFLIPDILCNAGGVTVSYYEWVQNRIGDRWAEAEVRRRLEERMVQAFREVVAAAEARRVPLRTAAYMVALDRIGRALALRGLLPALTGFGGLG